MRQSASHFHAKVIRARRNDQRMIIQLQSDDALHRRTLCKNHSNARLILIGGPVGRVVHLEHQV